MHLDFLSYNYNDDPMKLQQRIKYCIKKVKPETFIKAFDQLNDKIHYAAENGLISLNDKKFKKAIIMK